MTPTHHDDTAGIILVGGRSSRMGQNKALLTYNGQPLYLHMSGLLRQAGLTTLVLAGDVPGADNCLCEPLPHQGPARALAHIIDQLQGRFRSLLVVPVDMPLLTPALLSVLLSQHRPCYYAQHPLPALLTCEPPPQDVTSMRALLVAQQAQALSLPVQADPCMQNFNTPEEWARMQADSGEQGSAHS